MPKVTDKLLYGLQVAYFIYYYDKIGINAANIASIAVVKGKASLSYVSFLGQYITRTSRS